MDNEKHISVRKVVSKIAFNTQSTINYLSSLQVELNHHVENTLVRPELQTGLQQLSVSLGKAIEAFEDAAKVAAQVKDMTSKPKGDI